MKIRLLGLLIVLLQMLMPIHGQEVIVANPALDYVSLNSYQDGDIPQSNEVWRLDLDLYGNKKPITFLTFRGLGDRDGNIWTAYVPTAGGFKRIEYTSNGNLIQFRPNFFSIDPRGGLFVVYPGRDGGEVFHYTFTEDKAEARHVRSVEYAKADDKAYVETILKRKLEHSADFDKHPANKMLSVEDIKAGKQ